MILEQLNNGNFWLNIKLLDEFLINIKENLNNNSKGKDFFDEEHINSFIELLIANFNQKTNYKYYMFYKYFYITPIIGFSTNSGYIYIKKFELGIFK